MLASSNRTLQWHCEEYFAVRFALMYGNYDVCVIQQFGHPFPGVSETEPYLRSLTELCRAVGTKPVLFMTWAKAGEPEQTESLIRDYHILAERFQMPLAPIGELFSAVRREYPEIELYWRDGAHTSPCGTYLIAATIAALLMQPEDLSKLSDRSFDFQVHFVKEGMSYAETERKAVVRDLPAAQARALRQVVETYVLQNRQIL